ncbi:unnamed protein product, partial [Ectocarpus sp. 13 AM-2016]
MLPPQAPQAPLAASGNHSKDGKKAGAGSGGEVAGDHAAAKMAGLRPAGGGGAANGFWRLGGRAAKTAREEGGRGGGDPESDQGLVVSRGVSVTADVHVPFATVAVTRGGKLCGRIVAKEFLLEDG